MCGIAGFSHTTDVTRRMAPHLLWDIESRGKDSWGATDGLDTVRVLGPVTNTYVDNRDIIEGWERTIFHTRGASTGEVTVENQHPFYFVEGEENTPGWKRSIMGIHNGIVNNHSELNRKYSRNFSVDSMHIFKHLVERRVDHPRGNRVHAYAVRPQFPGQRFSEGDQAGFFGFVDVQNFSFVHNTPEIKR